MNTNTTKERKPTPCAIEVGFLGDATVITRYELPDTKQVPELLAELAGHMNSDEDWLTVPSNRQIGLTCYKNPPLWVFKRTKEEN